MKEINGSSEKISRILRVIDEIAFQANILALNAAVEPARAGETDGFAAVADEVRNLAQRSAQAARETGLLIEASINKSREGGANLGQVTESSQEQSHGIGQISTAHETCGGAGKRPSGNNEGLAALVAAVQAHHSEAPVPVRVKKRRPGFPLDDNEFGA